MKSYIEERNIGLAILFSVITCGIYGLYWLYKLAEESDLLTIEERDSSMSPAMILLLSIVTCGIFEIYWVYTMGEKFKDYDRRTGNPVDENLQWLYLGLGIASYFLGGVPMIVNFALMQDRINHIIRSAKKETVVPNAPMV